MWREFKTWNRNKAETLSEALLSLMIHGTSLNIPITAHFNMCYVYVKTAVLCETEHMFCNNRLHKTSLLRYIKAHATLSFMVPVFVVVTEPLHLPSTKP